MTYNQGDIVLINFPFTSGKQIKKRPCLVISKQKYNKERHEIIAVPITGQIDRDNFIGDYLIKEWNKAGLLKPSIIKCILFTLEDSNVIKKLGKLEDNDLNTSLKSILSVI